MFRKLPILWPYISYCRLHIPFIDAIRDAVNYRSQDALVDSVMPRGFQVDREATANHKFLDRRSFISKPKLLHQENIGHYILYGKDKSNAHDLVMYLSDGICAICKKPCTWEGEWDHIGNRGGERCDCVGNGRWVHGFLSKDKCHQVRHHQAKPHKEKLNG